MVAQFTSNLAEKSDPACLLIEAAGPEGKAAGLTQDSLVLGYMLSVVSEALHARVHNLLLRVWPQGAEHLDRFRHQVEEVVARFVRK